MAPPGPARNKARPVLDRLAPNLRSSATSRQMARPLKTVKQVLCSVHLAAVAEASSAVAVLKPVNPSRATISSVSHHASCRSANHCLTACFERPSIMSICRDGPVPLWIGVRSMITVTICRRAGCARHVFVEPDCGDAVEPARVVDQRTLPSARTASFAVDQDASRPSGIRATLRC